MLVVEPLEERAQQRRLAGADLAGQDDEALALADPVDELGQRLAVARRLEEELRIRRGTEWCLAEPVELEVHDIYLPAADRDRKSTRLNSSHSQISYAVFCLKKKKQELGTTQ